MTTRYPKHPQLVGNYAPLRMECDIDDAIVRGELPRDLDITYYRNGPDPQFPPRAGYHWFGGDAMVHMFRIRDGRVRYRNRWARTTKWRLERREGRSLYNPFNPKDNDPVTRELPDEGLANTNVVFHGGRLLALYETAAPFELDADTLESVGAWDFNGALPGPMTAHPKFDPATGEMVFFGCVAHPGSRDMYYHVADASGLLIHTDRYEAPYAGMVHDFLVTDEHVAFPHFPLTRDFARVLRGGSLLAWEPEKGTHVGVMRRDGSASDMRTFETGPCYGFHPVNAYTDGDRLIAHWLMFGEAPGFPRADGRPKDPDAVRAHLCEWTVDLRDNSNGIAVRYLDDIAGEMPRFDERFAGRPYRHAYYAGYAGTTGFVGARHYNAVVHHDFVSGTRAMHVLPEGDATDEPVFVPRSPDASEGDGYLVSIVYRALERRSDLIVLDATDVSSSPMACIELPHRVPYGFHGCWRYNA